MKHIADTLYASENSKTVYTTEDENQARMMEKQLTIQGYHAEIEKHGNTFHVVTKPRNKVPLHKAEASGMFTKLAFGRYVFNKTGNNKLGFEEYDFDEGTIWKVVKSDDGKEYLVKEVEDDNEDAVIRQKDTKAVVAAANTNSLFKKASSNMNTNSIPKEQLKKYCKVLYNNPSEEFIDDLMDCIPNQLSSLLLAKLDAIVNKEISASKYMSSPRFAAKMKEKIKEGISGNTVFNVAQICKMIREESK